MSDLYPVRPFEHLGEKFDPKTPVPADHPMVGLRPDLFTDVKPASKKPSTTKE